MRRSPMPRRSSPMRRSTALTQAVWNRRRKARSADEVRARKAVRARSSGVCEVCGRARATNFQHRKAQAHQGPWSAENGLDVCGHGNLTGCHGRIHQNPTEAYVNGWSVRSGHNPATTPVLIHSRGRCLLAADGTYLPVEENDAA